MVYIEFIGVKIKFVVGVFSREKCIDYGMLFRYGLV